MSAGNKIAIVGMSVKLPGANTPEEFWSNLKNGVESTTFLTKEQISEFLGKPVDENVIPVYGLVDGVDKFDPQFFGYSPKEASLIDPQQRIFLECCWQALESAGYDPSREEHTIGVYAGQGQSLYAELLRQDSKLTANVTDWQIRLSTASDFISTRVSYKLGLTGPAMTIQTACSTSLVAVCQAVQSLLAGDCDMALAGGASINYLPRFGSYEEGGVLSPDGRCRPFDSKARGTVASDGVGVVVLKRLEDALRDKDTIHSVIIGSASNNDGSNKMGFSAPSANGQAQAIYIAQQVADVQPEDISYVECHGTGTLLGDPIEASGLAKAFGPSEQKTCFLSSAKSNIGHTDIAAGVVGLIKATLALKEELIPKTLHFENLNNEVILQDTPFQVAQKNQPWPRREKPRRAGISSFGIGGTNAHVILEEAPLKDPNAATRMFHLIPLSSNSADSLSSQCRELQIALQKSQVLDLQDIAYTLQMGKKERSARGFAVASNLKELQTQLKQASQDTVSSPISDYTLLFPGQGGQYLGMGSELYQSESLYRETCDACMTEFASLGIYLAPVFQSTENRTPADDIFQDLSYAQAAIFTIELATAKLLLSFFKQSPKVLAAHSLGMYAAACLAGVFDLKDVCKMIAKRSELLKKAPKGAMLAINGSIAKVQDLLGKEYSISAINSDSQFVVSGLVDDITKLSEQLEQRDIDFRKLRIAVGGHSHLMKDQVQEFENFMTSIQLNEPQMQLISDLTGKKITTEQACSNKYWASHLTNTVLFHSVMETLHTEFAQTLFIEVGPGHSLTSLMKQKDQAKEIVTTTTIPHVLDLSNSQQSFLNALGTSWKNGIAVDWNKVSEGHRGFRIELPASQAFDRQKFQVAGYDLDRLKSSSSSTSSQNSRAEALPIAKPVETTQDAILVEVCAEFTTSLGISKIDSETHFFRSGGDSLMAIQMLKTLRKKYAIQIPAKGVFQNPTPLALSQFIKKQMEQIQ